MQVGNRSLPNIIRSVTFPSTLYDVARFHYATGAFASRFVRLALGDNALNHFRAPTSRQDNIVWEANVSGDMSHPRLLGWRSTVALAMGGSNQSLFLITALFVGQGGIPGQGSAAVPLLIVGLLLSYAAAPGWTELVLMSPNRVGGIAAACTTAFRPYSSILSALAGVCYWWGWVPTCGLTAILSATAINNWCLPNVPVSFIACTIVLAFTAINLCGIKWVSRLAIPVALASALLAFVSMIAPIVSGQVNWARAVDFHLTLPFPGWFGTVTSTMGGLYLIGFGAPAFEAATCHVGETINPTRNVPRAVLISGLMAAVYFVFLPLVWLGSLGPNALGHDLSQVLGQTFVPIFGGFAKAAAIGFMVFNMLHGTLQPLAGAARTLSQIAEDGLIPRFLAKRSKMDVPWAATVLTAVFAVAFLLIGDPIWLVAAANFTYLIGICLPSVAVWLLRRDQPTLERPYKAPRYTVELGLAAAAVWGFSALLGFEQFGLPTVLIGLMMAYTGAFLYSWRQLEDRWRSGQAIFRDSLHLKLTGAMVLVIGLDAAGYIMAVHAMPGEERVLATALADIFVLVAFLTISVGLVLPGIIANSADQLSSGAERLAAGTVRDFVNAMKALGEGKLEAAYASIDITPMKVRSRDELGRMAASFNLLQCGINEAAVGLDMAREGLSRSRAELIQSHAALENAKEKAVYDALHDGLTGLPNRTFFFEDIVVELANAREQQRFEFAVLFIDLDRFKTINDSLGHFAGNQLLIEVAARLERTVKAIVEDPALKLQDSTATLARLAGDEFTVLLRGVTSAEVALAAASLVLRDLSMPFLIDGRDVYPSASIGVALGNPSNATPDDLLREADLAMYKAKSEGRGRAEIFRTSMRDEAKIRLDLESDLQRALVEDEFELHYQAIVSIADQRILAFEALIRWRHKSRGLISPAEFIPIAEDTGFIVPLGLWIFREACQKLVDLETRFGRDLSPCMSVNLSPRQFAQGDVVEQIRKILDETKAPADRIKIEITESGTIGDPERAVQILSAMKRLGLQLSIDDFGTGYSSLSYLHKLPLDTLKIDRSFISNVTSNKESLQIVKAIVRLAKTLDMNVVAEGIEDASQAAKLHSLGCEFGQGYLYSKPVCFSDAEALLATNIAASDNAAALWDVLKQASKDDRHLITSQAFSRRTRYRTSGRNSDN